MSQAPRRPQPARPFTASPGSSAGRGSRNPEARTRGSQEHATLNPRLRPSLRALGGRLGGTWERDRRDTLFLLAVTLLAVLPHALYLPFWCTAGFAILFAWRLGLLVSGRPLPGRWIRILASLAVVGAVYAQFRTLVGQEAGVALVLLFLGLKLLEMRTRRDFYITVFLGFFLLLAAYLHSQSILMGAWTLLAIPALLAVLLTIQYQQAEVPLRTRLRQAVVLLLQALPLAIILFVLFPRPSGPLWGNQNQQDASTTGLSDSMAPGDFSKLAESNEVVMRVEFQGDAPAPSDMYWRGPSFGHFDGRRWTALPPSAERSLPPPQVRVPQGSATWQYTITREPGNNRWLLGLDTITQTPEVGDEPTAVLPTMEWVRQSPLTERMRFVAQSRPGSWTGLNETERSLHNWLQLPPGFNPRALALARQWRQQLGDDPNVLAAHVLRWIREEPFHYTLSPPKLGKDSIDEFLFESRAGFCEHYSSAFVFMMRAMGVPARVVTGYQGAEHHAQDDYWIVRRDLASEGRLAARRPHGRRRSRTHRAGQPAVTARPAAGHAGTHRLGPDPTLDAEPGRHHPPLEPVAAVLRPQQPAPPAGPPGPGRRWLADAGRHPGRCPGSGAGHHGTLHPAGPAASRPGGAGLRRLLPETGGLRG